MENKVKVICTSTGCIEYAPERYRHLGIGIIRSHFFFKGKEYLEGLDLDPDFRLQRDAENVKDTKNNLPHTAIPTYDDVAEPIQTSDR
jgi:fatty acid-binding protein DegV